MTLVQVWALMALAWATTLPFLFNGTGISVDVVDVVEMDHSLGLYNVTVDARNANQTINDVTDGYFTTLRAFFVQSSDGKLPHNDGEPLCSTIRGGCPVAPFTNFTFSFNATLKRGLHYLENAELHVELAEMHRFMGTLEIVFTRQMTFGMQYGIGVFAPLVFVLVSILKYFMVIWLDPEPVSNWNPLNSGASGANELAALGSTTQVMRQLQFVAFTSIIDVQFPAYYQSLYAKLGWVIGIIPNNWVSGLESPRTADDGLASLAGASQLESLMYFAGVPTVADLWPVNTVAFIGLLVVVGACSFFLKRKSPFRLLHTLSTMLNYWFSVMALPLLFVVFTSLMYLTKIPLGGTPFYITNGMKMYTLSRTLPYAFALNDRFYETPVSPGVIFTMALYMCCWLAAVVFFICVVYGARKSQNLTRSNLVLWGRYFYSSRADLWYQILETVLVVLQASMFSFLSKSSLAQVILLLICQLAQFACAYGTRPHELSFVGFCLILIPRILSISVCCLLFPLVPTVVKTYPNLLKPVAINRVVFTMNMIHATTLLYLLCLNIFCACTTVWRHFKLQPTPKVCTTKTIPFTDIHKYVSTDVYYRPPRNQPSLDDSGVDEEAIISKNYAIREVDFVYGINGVRLPHDNPIPLESHPANEAPPTFVDKLFKPNPKAASPGFEVIRYPVPRASTASDAPMLATQVAVKPTSSNTSTLRSFKPEWSTSWRPWTRKRKSSRSSDPSLL